MHSALRSNDTSNSRRRLHPALRAAIARTAMLDREEELAAARALSAARLAAWSALRPGEDAAALVESDRDCRALRAEIAACTWRRRRNLASAALRNMDAAVRVLENGNLRLAVSVASAYLDYAPQTWNLDDLVGYAVEGLRAGILRYDAERGFRLSTYATPWIRHKVSRALANEGRTIRLPVQVVGAVGKVRKFVGKFQEQHGRAPERSEIGAAMGMKPGALAAVLNAMALCVMSLDNPTGNGSSDDHLDDRTLADRLVDEALTPADDAVAEQDDARTVDSALAVLRPVERLVIERRVGIGGDGQDFDTLKEIGGDLALSRERIRQIEAEALGRMRLAMGVVVPTQPIEPAPLANITPAAVSTSLATFVRRRKSMSAGPAQLSLSC